MALSRISRFERRRLSGSSLAGGNFRQYLLLAHERHPNDKWRVFPTGTEWSSCWVGTHRRHRSQSRWSSGPALAGKRFRQHLLLDHEWHSNGARWVFPWWHEWAYGGATPRRHHGCKS